MMRTRTELQRRDSEKFDRAVMLSVCVLLVVMLFAAPAMGANDAPNPLSSSFEQWALGIVAALVVLAVGGLGKVAMTVHETVVELRYLKERQGTFEAKTDERLKGLNDKVNANDKEHRGLYGSLRDMVLTHSNTPINPQRGVEGGK